MTAPTAATAETQIVKQDFVTFLLPATLVPEKATMLIGSWDPYRALEMAGEAAYGNIKPYAFYFSTKTRGPEDLDSTITEESHHYFIGGAVRTLEELERDPEKNQILIANMRSFSANRVINTDGLHPVIRLMKPQDIVLDPLLLT